MKIEDFHRNLDRLKMDEEFWRIYYEPIANDLYKLETHHVNLIETTLEARYRMEYGENSFPILRQARILVRYNSQNIFIGCIDSYLMELRQKQVELAEKFENLE